jgi:hypothetical protein
VKLRFLGKNSTPGDSPTLYASDQDSYVIQGWKVFANDLLMQLDVPEGQTVMGTAGAVRASDEGRTRGRRDQELHRPDHARHGTGHVHPARPGDD